MSNGKYGIFNTFLDNERPYSEGSIKTTFFVKILTKDIEVYILL